MVGNSEFNVGTLSSILRAEPYFILWRADPIGTARSNQTYDSIVYVQTVAVYEHVGENWDVSE